MRFDILYSFFSYQQDTPTPYLYRLKHFERSPGCLDHQTLSSKHCGEADWNQPLGGGVIADTGSPCRTPVNREEAMPRLHTAASVIALESDRRVGDSVIRSSGYLTFVDADAPAKDEAAVRQFAEMSHCTLKRLMSSDVRFRQQIQRGGYRSDRIRAVLGRILFANAYTADCGSSTFSMLNSKGSGKLSGDLEVTAIVQWSSS